MRKFLFATILSLALLISFAGAAIVGTASINAPAVVIENNTGVITQINLTVVNGNGTVEVIGPQVVGNSTLQSAEAAAMYASQYLNKNASNYNFYYNISTLGNVSGPSAGAAMTIAAISALSGRPLVNGFTMTGTISGNGSIGPIGGVYDKIGAASADKLKFIMVPRINGGFYSMLYLLSQDTFGIPVIQVSNISEAYQFAFNKNANLAASRSNYSFSNNLNTANLPGAPLTCSNNCSEDIFQDLSVSTLNFANDSINALSDSGRFNGVISQMKATTLQDSGIISKGYLYTGSDLAFRTYLDSFVFDNYLSNITVAETVTTSIKQYCDSLSPPQLTKSNYEYVLGGELRQSWGEITSESTLQSFNYTSELTTDDALFNINQAAAANAWCTAADTMYRLSNQTNVQTVVTSPSLSSIAYTKVSRLSTYGTNLYLTAANDALSAKNYALAMLEADYGYAIENSSEAELTMNTTQLLSNSTRLAKNSTYGAWATQFANEAMFYVYQSNMTTNSTLKLEYAQESYTAAFLANQMSSDMALIYNSMEPGNSPQTTGVQQTPSSTSGSYYTDLVQMLNNIVYLVIVMIVINVVLLGVVLYLLLPATKAGRVHLSQQQKKGRKASNGSNSNG
ncbi:MAG: hypothetical protein M1504_00520 [Candidatus Marsarchaeota archaeon]|nr:hypothetical protein [Candidatus Marsarchaeota archaeon]